MPRHEFRVSMAAGGKSPTAVIVLDANGHVLLHVIFLPSKTRWAWYIYHMQAGVSTSFSQLFHNQVGKYQSLQDKQV